METQNIWRAETKTVVLESGEDDNPDSVWLRPVKPEVLLTAVFEPIRKV